MTRRVGGPGRRLGKESSHYGTFRPPPRTAGSGDVEDEVDGDHVPGKSVLPTPQVELVLQQSDALTPDRHHPRTPLGTLVVYG